MGAVVEIVHTATLVHDDIIDGADVRRGRPSTNSRWGNHMSVLAGDWMYMQSFQLALREPRFGFVLCFQQIQLLCGQRYALLRGLGGLAG